ncbi:NAD-binding protein [Kitasatospora sp. NPDC053057]|uniref:NAD-binding protein n=1 Tax=Kitasatospora sp. NPDC053057 TaxID=3364062 RepID=UPI0037C6C696
MRRGRSRGRTPGSCCPPGVRCPRCGRSARGCCWRRTKGRSAVDTLLGQGVKKEEIVVVDPQRKVIEHASQHGLVGVVGDATRTDTLVRAAVLQLTDRVIVIRSTAQGGA